MEEVGPSLPEFGGDVFLEKGVEHHLGYPSELRNDLGIA
jgi:hypothetical protein